MQVKANGNVLGTWDKYLSATLLHPSSNTPGINSILIANSPDGNITWSDVAANTKLFDIVTSEKITSFEIFNGRPKYGPGWNIYENDELLVSETSNLGPGSEPSGYNLVHTISMLPTTLTSLTSSVGDPEIYIDAHIDEKGGYTIPHTIITENGISCWNCGENWNSSDGGVYNTTTPVALTGASMSFCFWAKAYPNLQDNHFLYHSNGSEGFRVRFMYKARNTNEHTRTFNNGGWREWTDPPTATLGSWEFIMMVFNGNQVTSYIVPYEHDITQGLIENTHYSTDTFAGSVFGNDPITHIVGHSTDLYRNNRIYLASTIAWNKILTLEEVKSVYEITKP